MSSSTQTGTHVRVSHALLARRVLQYPRNQGTAGLNDFRGEIGGGADRLLNRPPPDATRQKAGVEGIAGGCCVDDTSDRSGGMMAETAVVRSQNR